jgi:hypothetical protein
MEVLDSKTEGELLKSMLAEMAKAQNELRCLRNDLDKAQGRLSFLLAVINSLIKRRERFKE